MLQTNRIGWTCYQVMCIGLGCDWFIGEFKIFLSRVQYIYLIIYFPWILT